jgi:hypothetical protein
MSDSLSAWPVAPGVSWIQTNNPGIARKLVKRSDTRLVGVGVAGGYLRIFEMRRSPAFIRRLVIRYMAANARFSTLTGTQYDANGSGGASGRRKRQSGQKSENPHDGKSADSQKFTRDRSGSEVTNEG